MYPYFMSGTEDGTEPPFQILQGLQRLAFLCLLVDEVLYRLDGDFGQLYIAELGKVMGTDIGLVSVLRRPFLCSPSSASDISR